MQKNPQSFGGILQTSLIVVALLSCVAIYCQWNFPSDLRDIVAQKFESHPAKPIKTQIRDFMQMNPKFYRDQLIGICQDVQIDRNDIAYCITQKNNIVSIATNKERKQSIGKLEKGKTYGIRLSKDQKNLYFVNLQIGFGEFNIKTGKINVLATEYEGKFLTSLDAIQIHPTNPNIIYITQASYRVPLSVYHIDLMLNNPFGRLYEFDKQAKKLTLIVDGLYFANGIVFQKYHNQETVLVAETNRVRLMRVYVSGANKGKKQIAVDKLDFYIDNVKINEKGQLWVAGPSARDSFLQYADYHPWVRKILSRLPYSWFKMIPLAKYFGGMKIVFSQNKQDYKVQNYLWNSLPEFQFSTTLHEKNDKLYISSLRYEGVLVVQNINEKLKSQKYDEQVNNKKVDQNL